MDRVVASDKPSNIHSDLPYRGWVPCSIYLQRKNARKSAIRAESPSWNERMRCCTLGEDLRRSVLPEVAIRST